MLRVLSPFKTILSGNTANYGGGLWVRNDFTAVTDDADTLLVSPDEANTYENNTPEVIFFQS